jgi:branched-chain amino acid transport system substrate-binding protein
MKKAHWLFRLLAGVALTVTLVAQAQNKPVYIGIDAEFGYAGSTSAEAIRQGILIAVEEINRAGGVLGGRRLELVERVNDSIPARAIENIRELAAMPDLVAVFCSRFSPPVLEALPTLHQLALPLLNPWTAADSIVDNGYQPNFVFRLSLSDSWALPAMLSHAEARGERRVGLLLLNSSWGRGSLKAAEAYVSRQPRLKIVDARWFNQTDKSFRDHYLALVDAGAQAVLLVANNDVAEKVKELAQLPAAKRVPIVSHWGVTGGRFLEDAGFAALQALDFSVVQTYSFLGAKRPQARRVLAAAQRLFGVDDPRRLPSPVGVAHAYDLTHILALAINRAGSTDRRAIRDALEQVKNYDGLIKTYPQPFSPTRHDALGPEDVFMARYAADGALERLPPRRP